jgi:hypothetical protein
MFPIFMELVLARGHLLPFPRASDTVPSGRHIPLLTELEILFDFGFYKYAAPDGAETTFLRFFRRF